MMNENEKIGKIKLKLQKEEIIKQIKELDKQKGL